nr:disease resistance protein RPP13-like isoform X2 [Ipomoea trifida]
MRFEWGINNLSKLPRFEVLKLYRKSCGKEWKIQDEVIFCQLIALVILDCDLKHWIFAGYTTSCYELREIPIDFAEISTLKSFKLVTCLHSTVKSAKKIQDEQLDYGNYNIVGIEECTFDNVLKSRKD